MAPHQSNRGYLSSTSLMQRHSVKLQWVHGQVTVVIPIFGDLYGSPATLQWVHGQVTVVIREQVAGPRRSRLASMGPRSGNRGYRRVSSATWIERRGLQWVHGQV